MDLLPGTILLSQIVLALIDERLLLELPSRRYAMGLTYRDSGVDIEGGNTFVKKIGPLVSRTFSDRVITSIGGFGALFDGSFPEMKEPVLVSGTDGVGTKLQVARMAGRHTTIGIDAVAMCVNDIVTLGAKPLFFLDYLSCGKLDVKTMTDIVSGIAEGCRRAECSLIGGETAEHPDIMPAGDYDIAGFSVGVVDRSRIIDGTDITPGDLLIGLPSSGIHSNGYSLVRKLLFTIKKYSLDSKPEGLDTPLGEALLEPTRIYVRTVHDLLDKGHTLKGLVHITGGGFLENIPRVLPSGMGARIETSSITLPPIFDLIQRDGEIEKEEMYRTFNMGIGMILVVPKKEADACIKSLKVKNEKGHVIGVITDHEGVELKIE